MMKQRIGMLAVVGAMLGVAAIAPAQLNPVAEKAFSAKVGAFLPTNGGGNNSSWFMFGIDYRIHQQLTEDKQNVFVSVSLDYAGKDSVRTVPLLANVTRYFDNFYLTGGVGATFSRLPGDDRTRFAYQVGAGYDVPNWELPIFVEARFLGTDNSRLNGFGIAVGVRF